MELLFTRMEDFVVSARKYRPKTFDTVVGQEKITQTLLRSIENNHLAQAFLFCGPRGVGKTTCARILARTVNQHGIENPDPNADYGFNIFELDAASNNSVDDIRSLIDQVRIPPQTGKYKVYIIDEVHMLSSNAFNAFLKTLEEPPPYAIFIMATTEKHKVLPTILSRCQIFDFSRIQIPEMVDHLSKIAAKENITVGSDALHIIAEKADGALRDALSIFDQMVSFSGNTVTYEDVINHLNILDYDYYFSLTDAFLKGDRTHVLLTYNKIINQGFDGHNFVNGLAAHMRNLLFSVTPDTAALLEVGETIRERYLTQSRSCDTRFLLNAIHALSEADVHYKTSRSPRLLVEITLLKLCGLAGRIEEKKNDDGDVFHGIKNEPAAAAKPEAVRPVAASVKEPEKQEIPLSSPVEANTQPASTPEPNIESPKPISEPETKNEVSEPPAQPLSEDQKDESESDSPLVPETMVSTEPAALTVPAVPAVPAENKSTAPITAPREEPTGEAKPRAAAFSSRLSMGKTKGMTSINSLTSETAAAEERQESGQASEIDLLAPQAGKPATDFNMARLWEVWKAYTETIKEEGRQSYYATLTRHDPILKDGFKIEFLVDNDIQKIDLDNDKSNLLGYLREKLTNWQISLESIVKDDDATDDMELYAPDAKYKEMVKINPNLGKLRELYDLEVDYDD